MRVVFPISGFAEVAGVYNFKHLFPHRLIFTKFAQIKFPANMQFVIFCAFAIVVVCAAPLDSDKDAKILKYESDNIGIDGYNFEFETSNGLVRSEHAEVRNIGTDQESIAIRGTISYVGADGQTYTVDFVADENGFQPAGAHLV